MYSAEIKTFCIQEDTLKLPKPKTDTLPSVKGSIHQMYKVIEINSSSDSRFKAEKLNKSLCDSINNNLELNKINYNDKTLINNYIDTVRFSTVRDSNCYIIKNQKYIKKCNTVFLNKPDVQNRTETTFSIKEKQANINNWTILPLISGLILLAFIFTIYRKYIGLIFENAVYQITKNKIFTDKNVHFQRFAFILDVLFIISFALIADRIIQRFGFFMPPEKYKYLIFVVFCAFFIVLKLFRVLIFSILEIFSSKINFFKELINSSTLYTRTLGILLLPMVFLITYSTSSIASLFIYLSIFIIAMMLIMRIISMLKVFILSGLSIFYFILYLCALEIAPLLVIWKEVTSR